MQSLNEIIAENLKKIRKEKHLSLDKIAQLSGVSKSMLSQIEKCEVNPTISTLKKMLHKLLLIHFQKKQVSKQMSSIL